MNKWIAKLILWWYKYCTKHGHKIIWQWHRRDYSAHDKGWRRECPVCCLERFAREDLEDAFGKVADNYKRWSTDNLISRCREAIKEGT